jgi:hypothetical protein
LAKPKGDSGRLFYHIVRNALEMARFDIHIGKSACLGEAFETLPGVGKAGGIRITGGGAAPGKKGRRRLV